MKPSLIDISILIFTAMLFGSSFVAIQMAVHGIPPLTLAVARLGIAAVALRFFGRNKSAEPFDRRRIILVALTGYALPFALINVAETQLQSGTTAILVASGPLIGVLFSHWMTQDDRIAGRKIVGLMIGFLGTSLALASGISGNGTTSVLASLAPIVAAVGYAVSGNLSRRIESVSPLFVVQSASRWGALGLLPFALAIERPWQLSPPPEASLAMAYLGLVPTAVGFGLRFIQIKRHGYTFASYAGFLAPVFCVVWARLVLGEKPDGLLFVSLGLTLLGLSVTYFNFRNQGSS